MTTLRFGELEWICLWRVQGRPDEDSAKTIAKRISRLIEMDVVSEQLDVFPHEKNGNGGEGVQYYMAWTESFLVISTWPELGFFRVYLASCKRFDPTVVTRELMKYGPILRFEATEI